MSQQALSYEVALFGAFYSKDLRAVLTRAALHAERAVPFRAREVVFEPVDAAAQRESGIEPVLLRARKEMRLGEVNDDQDELRTIEAAKNEEDVWMLYSYLTPESTRVHPDATVRPWAVTEVSGDALSFASALGYV
jgi:mediator of RNA polymerase II transcription subunit 18